MPASVPKNVYKPEHDMLVLTVSSDDEGSCGPAKMHRLDRGFIHKVRMEI